MIIIISLVFIVILGLFLLKFSNKYALAFDVGLPLSVIGGTVLLICLIYITTAYYFAPRDIQRNKIEYEGLCKRLEMINSKYEDVSKSDVVADITEWNIKVYNTKYWSSNPLTSWFCPSAIADNFEYIPLESR